MNRRSFVRSSFVAACGTSGLANLCVSWPSRAFGLECRAHTPVYSIIPVVGNGKWIWKDPPADQTGYLEPRQFAVSIGMRIKASGASQILRATTVVPVNMPEQRIDNVRIQTQGCAANVRQLAPQAGQLVLAAPAVLAGQVIAAVAHFRVTLYKEYHAYQKEQFPDQQEFPRDFRKVYMYDSPGIQTRQKAIRDMAVEVSGQLGHPWDKAKAFHAWVWRNIKPKAQAYTSVIEALRERVGDCEERAALFVAFCRASGIPARLVWVPNHNWAEFYLKDHEGQGHWIPAHTSAYSWFGWTGAHELVLQKGDSIRVPEKRKTQRLLADWMQWQGARPTARYTAELKPVADDPSVDTGPGARSKDAKGEWVRVGQHPLEQYTRK
jgi:hypothetical protein